MELLKSKKFQTSIVGVLVGVLSHFGLDLDAGALLAIMSPLLASIIGQGVADVGKERAKIEKGTP